MKLLRVTTEDKNLLPTRAHPTDAGLDLKAAKETTLRWDEITRVGTGIKVEIPKGYVGLVYPRSGLAVNYGINLANSVGVIDSDYRGEIICALKYRQPGRNSGYYVVKKYERIAQLVIVPIALPEVVHVKELENTVRGEGGFGSSG